MRTLLLLSLVFMLVSCRDPREAGPPNVLFIAIDDLNDWTGFLGGHPAARTPHMDELAESSTVFTNAHATATACQPSRNSVLWGLHPTTTGWYQNLFRRGELDQVSDSIARIGTALPSHFRNHGYHTMMAGKIFHYGMADRRGMEVEFWDEIQPKYPLPASFREAGHNYGDNFYFPFPHGGSPIITRYGEGTPGQSLCGGPLLRQRDIPGGEMPDEYFARWGEEKLMASYDSPFLLALGFVRPHVPFTAPEEFFEGIPSDHSILPDIPGNEMSDVPLYGKAMALGSLPGGDHHTVLDMGPAYWQELVQAYLASVAFVDEQVGKVLAALEQSPHANNTIVVLWSDHGQNLGEKHMWRKMNLWEEATHVPLIIREARQAKGQRVGAPVSLMDIYPTLAELAGIPPPDTLEGQSLVPLIRNPESTWKKPVLTSWHYDNFAVRSQNWRYIRYRDGQEELYDHRVDAGEHNNLAGSIAHAEVLDSLRAFLPLEKADPFFRPYQGDHLDRLVELWDSTGIPFLLR